MRFLRGGSATLTAMPEPGWQFMYWTNDAAGSSNPLSNTVSRATAIQAIFGTAVSPVISSGVGQLSTNPAVALFPFGSIIRLSATPGPGYYFTRWNGDEISNITNSPVNFVVTNANADIRV